MNSSTTGYLRNLEEEFGESTNAIRLELNKMEKAGLLQTSVLGNKKIFKANLKHPLFPDVQQIIRKHVGLDTIIENVIKQLGDISKVFLTGNYAKGIGGEIIDLTFIGNVNEEYLIVLIKKAEKLIGKKMRYIIYNEAEGENVFSLKEEQESLLLWHK